jgi:hypothetical protein
MMLRFVIALLRRVLDLMITFTVLAVLGRGPRARMVLKSIRLVRRIIRL